MQKRVGFAAHKLEPKPWATRDEWLQRNREMLARVLNLHTVVPFIGSGCSVPLGYPTWGQFAARLVDHALGELSNLRPTVHVNMDLERLARFQNQLQGTPPPRTDRFLFILGACKKLLEGHGPEIRAGYVEFLGELFKPRTHPSDAPNPYHALLGLPVDRFVTTNYDLEIERALADVRKIPESELGLAQAPGYAQSATRLRAFTQKPEYYDLLALFVMARVREAENMVFHCHGSCSDPDSIVATEEDYQRWYLADDAGAGMAFRQTLNLLLGSIPVLFVGFSLGDEDLMRPLRMFSAINRERKSSRPLFALLPEEESLSERAQQEKRDEYELLYDRYGVNVIPYGVRGSADPQTWGRALYEALSELERYRLECRDEWLQKPVIRRVDVPARPPRPYHQYPFVSLQTPDLGGDRVQAQLDELVQAAEAEARVIALVGPGGTGKSWYAQRLMNKLQRNKQSRFEGFFFWSSYYSNDALTGLDRALAYLDPDYQKGSNRIDRFSKCISEGRYLLIFDGIERFLQEGDNPDEGRAFTASAASFLKAMANEKSRSTVLLTSRLWPDVFNQFEPGSIRRCRLPLFKTDDLIGVEPFSWWKDNAREVSALCSLLDGHVYAIAIAGEMLRKAGKSRAHATLRNLRRTLTGTPPDLRMSRVIRESIDAADKEWKGVASKLLERLAVFFSIVARPTIAVCYQAATGAAPQENGDFPETLVEDLAARRLILKLTTKRGKSAPPAYTVHPIVRGYIYQSIHYAHTDALPSFALPGFTAATSALDPGSKKGVKMVTDLFDRLHNEAEREQQEGRGSDARRLCRSAFSVVRSRMELLTVPRWCSYDDYFRFIVRLSHLAKNVSPQVWDYAERHDIRSVEDLEGPLYADDLAWLYNELGLACYAEGAMLDALAVWEQGLEINRVVDSYEEGGSYLFQSQCNLGAAYIHAGHLPVAERYLLDAERTNYRLNDSDHAGRIKGYLGLLQHLRGNLPIADNLYQEALDRLKAAGGNPRAESIFLRHRCDLKIKLEDFDSARHLIESSRALAEAERYPELVAAARMSYGHWFRSQRHFTHARREYNVALKDARRIGARRLECEVLSELARLALELGDAEVARQRAMDSLHIANELALGLKQTHDLVVLGRATIESGHPRLGIAYLKHAKSLADRQGYWLRGHEAEEQLHRFGESVENAPTVPRAD